MVVLDINIILYKLMRQYLVTKTNAFNCWTQYSEFISIENNLTKKMLQKFLKITVLCYLKRRQKITKGNGSGNCASGHNSNI